jgi:hypothetical protein
MTCKELLNLLSSGARLTPEADAHLAACARCTALVESLEQRPAEPSATRVASIQQALLSSLRPVRPAPSNRVLATAALAGAVVLAFLCALPAGYLAFRSLSAPQMVVYYGLILVVGILLAVAIAQDMIPGAKRTISRSLLIGTSFVVLTIAVLLLFPNFAGPRFVFLGLGCLRLGTLSAAVAGVAAYLFLRRGFLTTPVETWGLAGTFAGLVGFAVLALHCPIQQSGHILAWHLGAMAIAGCGGALSGVLIEFLARFRRLAA